MWQKYYSAATLDDALKLLSDYRERARIIAGGTDLILELDRELRPGVEVLIDISRIGGLDAIVLDENEVVHLGPLVTHNHCVASKLLRETAFPLVRAAWEVGAPQIRNRGTVAGNLITASPANDTITPLMALGASVTLRSHSGERVIPLNDFYLGVRKTLMQPDEMLVDISFPAMTKNQRGTFLKLGLRRAQAISVVNVALIVTLEGEKVTQAAIALGSVAPKIVRAIEAERFLAERSLDEDVIGEAARLAMKTATPIDDLRGSAAYRREMVRVLISRGLRAISNGEYQLGFPEQPPLLWGQDATGGSREIHQMEFHTKGVPIRTQVNGVEYQTETGFDKTLLDFLREDVGLIGTKEGCAEGECGACTVFLDGVAVMACLVPAARAHGAEIVTVEGLGNIEQLHPVQDAFVHAGAVQCGYCTPGFLMSAAKLLEENPQPTGDQIRQAITGNLCRCTGYYKIVEAIEMAAIEMAATGKTALEMASADVTS